MKKAKVLEGLYLKEKGKCNIVEPHSHCIFDGTIIRTPEDFFNHQKETGHSAIQCCIKPRQEENNW